jgi:hypothetical protein
MEEAFATARSLTHQWSEGVYSVLIKAAASKVDRCRLADDQRREQFFHPR